MIKVTFGRTQEKKQHMAHITVNDQQANAIANAQGHIEVHDQRGNCLGVVIQGISRAAVETANRRAESDGPWRSTEQVLKRLKSLESE
jgi:hypothetical protein